MAQIIEKKVFHIFYFFLFLLLNYGVSGQTTNTKVLKQFEQATQYFMASDFVRAILEAKKIIEKSPEFVNAPLLLADIYNEMDSTLSEIKYLEHSLKYSGNPTILFRLAEASYSLGHYPAALLNYEKFIQSALVTDKRIIAVQRKIGNCKFSIEAQKNPVEFQPVRLNETINSANDEYWPGLSIDQQKLIFTRLLKNKGTIPQEDFYISEFDSADWGNAKPISEINTLENEGAQTLSADGKLIFFTACNRVGGIGSCDIYFSKLENGKWGTPRNAGNQVNTNFWEAQPSFASDNSYLYFSSNRTGGKGEKDIWRIKLTGINETGNLKWGEPENLGDSINTPGNEISPFIHPNNKSFYFASDFHIGMGKLDLFSSEMKTDGTFSMPGNLGYPINTNNDEQGLTISADGKTAYFASARETSSGLDIYNFELDEKMRPVPVTYIKANVVDSKSNLPVEAKIELVNLSDNQSEIFSVTAIKGEVLLCLPVGANYSFTVSEEGYLFFSQSFLLSNPKTLYEPYLFQIELNPVEIGAEMNLYNIYFETDSFVILPESVPELQKLVLFLKTNSNLKVEIQGHTDNSGTASKNQQLSENRAKSVMKYLIENGIEPMRLLSHGYGDTLPVATNENAEGRKLNRRTTVKIGGS